MSIWWTLHLRREAASVPFARRILLGTMDTAGVDPDISYEIGVALSEACANVVEHAGRMSSGARGGYQVTAKIEGDRCRIEVRDFGPGFPDRRVHGRVRRTRLLALWSGPERPGSTDNDNGPDKSVGEPAESGRGLYLIKALTDHVQFRNQPRRGGAVVSFDKALKWRDDALLKVS